MKSKCPYCGYVWTPRVANPKECPRCKRRIDYSRQEKIKDMVSI